MRIFSLRAPHCLLRVLSSAVVTQTQPQKIYRGAGAAMFSEISCRKVGGWPVGQSLLTPGPMHCEQE